MTTILHSASGLIRVAEYLQSMKVVSKAIDNKLLSQGALLYRSIANSPVHWMNLACSIKSEVIVRESLIHLVGNWSATEDTLKAMIHPEMQEVCKRKLEEQLQRKRQTINLMLGYYPQRIQRECESGGIGRASYSNDIMAWMALAIFRQYIGQAVALGLTADCKDGGFDFYMKISEGGQSYLDRQTVRQFHYRFPMSSKGQIVVEHQLDELKRTAKGFVVELMANKSQLDVQKYPVLYLTCLEVERMDIPWIREKLEGKGSEKKVDIVTVSSNSEAGE